MFKSGDPVSGQAEDFSVPSRNRRGGDHEQSQATARQVDTMGAEEDREAKNEADRDLANVGTAEVVVWGSDALGEADEVSLASQLGLSVLERPGPIDELQPDLSESLVAAPASPAGPSGSRCFSPSSSSSVGSSSLLFKRVSLPRQVAGVSGSGVNAVLFTDGSVLAWGTFGGRRLEVIEPQRLFLHPCLLEGDNGCRPAWPSGSEEPVRADRLEP